MLCSDCLKDFSGSSQNFGQGADATTMNGFPHFEYNDFNAEYPFANLNFRDKNFPANIKLTAFNPIIPLDSKNSSIPAAFFEIEFENTYSKYLNFQAAFSVCNPFSKSQNKNVCKGKGITMFDAENTENNLTLTADKGEITVCDYWYRGWRNSFYKDNIRTFWNEFSKSLPIKCRNYKEIGQNDHCTVCAAINVAPNAKKSVRFVLTRSIPQCTHYWGDKSGYTWKNYYATIFQNSLQSAAYSVENFNMLYSETLEFTNALYGSDVDESIKQAVSSALSVIKSPTVMRLENGDLYGWERVNSHDGSCEGLCQHVWNYAYVLCYLFPDLEMGIRNNTLKYGVFESGETTFRLPIPFEREYYINLFSPGEKFVPCVDGHMGEVIKVYHEWKLSGKTEWLAEKLDTVKKLIRFAYSPQNKCRWDANRSGVIAGRQHHTLDTELFGANAWLEGFYLAALKAGAQMAQALNDTTAQKEFSALFESGYNYTDKNLWNGEYYIQETDLSNNKIPKKFGCSEIFENAETGEINYQFKNGCMIDQCVAQWHSKLVGLGNVFDSEKIKTAVLSIYRNNFKQSFRNFPNPWRLFAINDEGGTVMCSYPNTVGTPKNPLPYSEEVMSRFEYAFAGLLIANNFQSEAENVVRAVRARYNGENRNPFNDIECGSNYARSMAAYSLLPLSLGFTADLASGIIGFAPKINKDNFNCIWNTATAYENYYENKKEIVITVIRGDLEISSIKLPQISEISSFEINSRLTDYSFNNSVVSFDRTKINNITIIKGRA